MHAHLLKRDPIIYEAKRVNDATARNLMLHLKYQLAFENNQWIIKQEHAPHRLIVGQAWAISSQKYPGDYQLITDEMATKDFILADPTAEKTTAQYINKSSIETVLQVDLEANIFDIVEYFGGNININVPYKPKDPYYNGVTYTQVTLKNKDNNDIVYDMGKPHQDETYIYINPTNMTIVNTPTWCLSIDKEATYKFIETVDIPKNTNV